MDIDIDLSPAFKLEKIFPTWARASVVQGDRLTAHPCGAYPQSIPVDPITGLSAVPYDAAEDLGYLKTDFLHLNFYSQLKSRAELEELLAKDPDWNLLLLPSAQKKLFQLSKHGDILDDLKPRGVLQLADVMALIRPGKKPLVGLYKKEREACRRALYAQDDSGYSFKKSHSVAYALVVVLQLHLIEQDRL